MDVAANVLDKQSWRGDKRWSSSLGGGRSANSPRHKETSMLRNDTHFLGDQWQTFVKTVMNLWDPQRVGNFLAS